MQLLGINLGYFIIAAGAAVIWILLREFNCWYWKINERLILLEEILNRLEKQERLEDQPPSSHPAPRFPEINID
jgi:hypothetical protein